MTTIIWKRFKDWTMQIAWDKRTSLASWLYLDETNKIMQLDNTLLWKAWDSLSNTLIKELYFLWKKDNNCTWINLITDAIDFYKFVKKSCNIYNIHNEWWEPNISFILMNEMFQIQIDNNWQVTELKSNDDILVIWSWANIALTLNWISSKWKFKTDLTFDDYFEVISSLDLYTSKDFDMLEIKD